MDIAIIASSKDPAGINIRNNVIKLFNFEKINEKFDGNDVLKYNKIKDKKIKLYLINQDLIFAENIDKKISADAFIFASKHQSREDTASFSAHAIGNWSTADFGGKEKWLCPSSGVLLKNLFIELNKTAKEKNFELSLEVTHHGPYVEKPAVFIEIGSTAREWNDMSNGEIIARTIMNGLSIQNKNYNATIGIGGMHYCPNFNKVVLRTDIAFSHICPKYMLGVLDEGLIKQTVEKTVEKVDFFVLDWKGLGTEKQRIVDLLKKLNLEFKRIDQILKD